ncbi:MAG: hypothetical protein JNK05_05245 [Myxococcales bacterium]|nr:hypothetical protein [Myxococcales bacterium]
MSKATRCARCEEEITEARAFSARGVSAGTIHLRCGVEINPELARYLFDAARRPIDDLAALRARVELRLAAERDANRKVRGKPVTVEQVRDHKGRPRVRVLAHETGPNTSEDHTTYRWLWQLARIEHFWSSLREYAIVWDRKARDTRVDPAQPIAAAIYYQCAGARVASFNGKLVEWRALGLAAPVIGISGVGARDSKVRDETVAKVRALLAKSGFDPDDAPVVTVIDADDAAREAMAMALDEQANKVSLTTERRKAEQVMASVGDLFEGERDDALAQTMISALKRFDRGNAEQKAALVERMIAFARRAPLEAAPLLRGVERYGIVLERDALRAIIEGILSHPEKVPAQTAGWLAYWQRRELPSDELTALVQHAIDHGPKKKAAKLVYTAWELEIFVREPE